MRGWLGAGLVAGVAMFIWGVVSHMLLPLGEMGIKPLPDEAAVLSTLADKIKTPGVYFFPGADAGNDMEKMSQAYAKYPHGLMSFTPSTGTPFSMGMPMAIQFVTDLILGVLLGWLLWHSWAGLPSFGSKVIFAAVIGLLASLSFAGPFWNWYGFGQGFFVSQLIDGVVGFGIGGAVIGWLMRR